ncbi:hypothetical protein CDAR_508281 [Caerostris darwini]|uniref:Uncharacterized protein n=1 Tax=Caerostris darwini TaxID=1538125 RepID=A0AAV4WQT1_9ARAC|nr:hypothetical protein CDAR_508281 [Caerostris darwini]
MLYWATNTNPETYYTSRKLTFILFMEEKGRFFAKIHVQFLRNTFKKYFIDNLQISATGNMTSSHSLLRFMEFLVILVAATLTCVGELILAIGRRSCNCQSDSKKYCQVD